MRLFDSIKYLIEMVKTEDECIQDIDNEQARESVHPMPLVPAVDSPKRDLHPNFFSGRRRDGDLQAAIERICLRGRCDK